MKKTTGNVRKKKDAKRTGRTAEAPKEAKRLPTFRPTGARVLVMFPQSDWVVGPGGFVIKTGLVGAGYRMDGMVMAVGTRDIPEGVGVGSTVYADPRLGEVVNVAGTRCHLMACRDLLAVAERERT